MVQVNVKAGSGRAPVVDVATAIERGAGLVRDAAVNIFRPKAIENGDVTVFDVNTNGGNMGGSMSWLKKFGQTVGRVLGFVASKGTVVIDDAATVAKILLPADAPIITLAQGIGERICAAVIGIEGTAAMAGSKIAGGEAKLQAVLESTGPAMDAWIAANFPGAGKLSDLSKAGLVNAFVAALNDAEGKPAA